MCEVSCSFHGDCKAGNYCDCDAGWFNDDCSENILMGWQQEFIVYQTIIFSVFCFLGLLSFFRLRETINHASKFHYLRNSCFRVHMKVLKSPINRTMLFIFLLSSFKMIWILLDPFSMKGLLHRTIERLLAEVVYSILFCLFGIILLVWYVIYDEISYNVNRRRRRFIYRGYKQILKVRIVLVGMLQVSSSIIKGLRIKAESILIAHYVFLFFLLAYFIVEFLLYGWQMFRCLKDVEDWTEKELAKNKTFITEDSKISSEKSNNNNNNNNFPMAESILSKKDQNLLKLDSKVALVKDSSTPSKSSRRGNRPGFSFSVPQRNPTEIRKTKKMNTILQNNKMQHDYGLMQSTSRPLSSFGKGKKKLSTVRFEKYPAFHDDDYSKKSSFFGKYNLDIPITSSNHSKRFSIPRDPMENVIANQISNITGISKVRASLQLTTDDLKTNRMLNSATNNRTNSKRAKEDVFFPDTVASEEKEVNKQRLSLNDRVENEISVILNDSSELESWNMERKEKKSIFQDRYESQRNITKITIDFEKAEERSNRNSVIFPKVQRETLKHKQQLINFDKKILKKIHMITIISMLFQIFFAILSILVFSSDAIADPQSLMVTLYISSALEFCTCVLIYKLFTNVKSRELENLRWITSIGNVKNEIHSQYIFRIPSALKNQDHHLKLFENRINFLSNAPPSEKIMLETQTVVLNNV